jgi:hypothetical protein
VLHLCRDLISLRRQTRALRTGAYEPLSVAGGVWAWRRGTEVAVAVNLSPEPAACPAVAGRIALSSGRDRDGAAFDGRLEPWEAVVLEPAVPSSRA